MTIEDKKQEITGFIGSEPPKVFGTIQKEDDTLIMVSQNNYKGYTYLDLRQWWQPPESTNYSPTKSGFTLPIKTDLSMLDELITVLQEAKRQLEEEDANKR